ncbi:STAS-like domain-containing protein [Patescibacteria group bacterium]
MIIYLKKFGTTLNSRQFGKESFAAFNPLLKDVKENEDIIVDFEGVITFTPSWGDEFLGSLLNKFGKQLILKNTENPSVQASLKMLEEIYKSKFRIQN